MIAYYAKRMYNYEISQELVHRICSYFSPENSCSCTGTHFVQNENIWKKVFSCDEKVLIMKIKNIRNIYDCEGI